MAVEYGKSYVLEEFRLEPEKCSLSRGGEQVRLANRPFQVLLYLIENRDRFVKRDELLEKFWDGREVYDEALTKAVGAIRRALDEPHENPRFIETRWAEGYRFIGNLEELNEPSVVEIERTRQLKIVVEENDDAEKREVEEKRRRGEEEINPQSAIRNPQSNVSASPLLRVALAVILVSALILLIYQFTRPTPQAVLTKPAPRSIAVLPFKNLTGDAANDYLADGMTENIINEVSRIESLKVVSRSSVFQFKNKDAAPQEIAAKLNVETILEGGIRRVGDRVRVEARLVNAKDGSVLWASDSQEKNIADIFAIQDEIARSVTANLKLKLNPADKQKQPSNVEAYHAFLKGLSYSNQMDLPKAVEFYKEALRLEPDYAPAHENLAVVYTLMETNSQVPPGTAAPLAEFHAQKSLELDANLVGAYLALGTVRTMQNYDLNERIRYYSEAARRNPNYLRARRWLSSALLAQGKFEEAEAELLQVQQSDPLSYGARLNLAEVYYYWRKPDKTIEQANLMLVANPNDKEAHNLLGKAYLQKGLFAEAAAEFEKADPNNRHNISVLMATGRETEARRAAEKFAASDAAKVTPYAVGCVFAEIGDKERALQWLEKAYEMRQADLVSMKIDPPLDDLRDDARFQDLLRRVGL